MRFNRMLTRSVMLVEFNQELNNAFVRFTKQENEKFEIERLRLNYAMRFNTFASQLNQCEGGLLFKFLDNKLSYISIGNKMAFTIKASNDFLRSNLSLKQVKSFYKCCNIISKADFVNVDIYLTMEKKLPRIVFTNIKAKHEARDFANSIKRSLKKEIQITTPSTDKVIILLSL